MGRGDLRLRLLAILHIRLGLAQDFRTVEMPCRPHLDPVPQGPVPLDLVVVGQGRTLLPLQGQSHYYLERLGHHGHVSHSRVIFQFGRHRWVTVIVNLSM